MSPGELARGVVRASIEVHRMNMALPGQVGPFFLPLIGVMGLVGMVGTFALGGWNDKVIVDYAKLDTNRGVVAVDAVLPLDRGVALADGSWLVQVGRGAHVFGWCEQPPEQALDVRGRVLGYVGAHALPEAIGEALDGATPGAVVLAIDGCHSGPDAPWDPGQRLLAPSRPVSPTHALHVLQSEMDRTHPLPVADGRTLYPLVERGGGPTEQARAWVLCNHDPREVRGGVNTNGRMLGWYGARHLPGQVAFALDRSNEIGWVESMPDTVVIEASCKPLNGPR